MSTEPACRCTDPNSSDNIWCDQRGVGVDTTNGRYGGVDIWRCKACRQLWLHYQVAYEGFSRSGRWARCTIDADVAATLEPEHAVTVLDAAPWCIYGGSYWNTTGKIGCGARRWDV